MRPVFLSFALFLFAGTQPAFAKAMQCGPRDMVLNMLAAQDQTRRAIGLAGRMVMEVFAAADSADWTITVTLADGRMCMLATGTAFEAAETLVPMKGVVL
ncbi:hypothetical protein [Roseinatronobacter bogoriensis]|uniref:Uncharacterized protein n=1 Tax=Roseinatronobacter bogoriensis subsp. barguzinensis TaxID=441209 RepID=A0A2K8KBE3_9RHOB|nr:hypothetical protein [Rhodobaca]ATX66734.1 hypothetical protein BG454_13650 [Rhodobaca barguzinensis]MBB4206192.1 hypothetical protein [Rhodobaca bogoriensis DSM 18756]TDW40936.1 hypothetical protein LY39_00031 [Rhodobaca barguzinensis]TDY74886.1 hypothetical protein EV660_101932 [Rhodobaca bogoriensis DSM 18756]